MGAAEFRLRGVAWVMLPSRGTGRWPVAKATSPKVKWVGSASPALALVVLAVGQGGYALDRRLSRARGSLLPRDPPWSRDLCPCEVPLRRAATEKLRQRACAQPAWRVLSDI